MARTKIAFLALVWALTYAPSLAQKIDSLPNYEGPTLELKSDKHTAFTIDNQQFVTDKKPAIRAANLTQLLARQTDFFIKEYGMGGLTTVSHRGGTASQTQIHWEGLNIQNPMLGQTDFSLLPMFFIDRVGLQKQAATAFGGSASVGGSLQLEATRPSDGWTARILYGLGQFGRHKLGLAVGYGKNNWAWRLRLWGLSAQNNFAYRDLNAFGWPKPIRQMEHAWQRQMGALQELYGRALGGDISLKIWSLYSFRAIAPTLLQLTSEDKQEDAALRIVANYQRLDARNARLWQVRQAAARELLYFRSPSVDVRSVFYNYLADFSVRQLWKTHLLEAATQYNYWRAISAGYPEPIGQNRGHLSLFYKYTPAHNKLIVTASAKLEAVQKIGLFSAAALGLAWRPSDNFSLSAQWNRNYRLPTFNDWYWQPGGNPDLQPEKNQLLGLNFAYNTSAQNPNFAFNLQAQPFAARSLQQIVWLPDSRTGLWAVSNVPEVRSAGLHLSSQLQQNIAKNHQLNLSAQYTFTRIFDTQTPDYQLFFSPKHRLHAALTYDYHKALQLEYSHDFTSLRYLDNTNSQAQAPYLLADLALHWQTKLHAQSLALHFQIHNLYNLDYQIMPNRPMPRRWLECSITLDLQPSKKSSH